MRVYASKLPRRILLGNPVNRDTSPWYEVCLILATMGTNSFYYEGQATREK